MAEHNEIGKIGEKIAKTFLMKQGFYVAETNYRTKYGEIDIIAIKGSVFHFVEVKSIKVKSFDTLSTLSVTPEDNFTKLKSDKVFVSAELYLRHKNVTPETKWQVDLACVYICMENREGRVKFLETVERMRL